MAIKNINEVEKALGLKDGEFKTLYDDKEEKELPLADFEIVKKADLNTRIENIKKSAQEAHTDITAKQIKQKYDLEVEGKDLEKIFDAYKTKIISEQKVPDDEKVKELQSDFSKMKLNYETEKKRADDMEATFAQKEKRSKINDAVLKKIPADTIIDREKVLTIFHTEFESDIDDKGKVIFKKNGELLKNPSTLDPQTIDDVMTGFITPYAKPISGGAGGKDNPGTAKPGGYEAFVAEMDKAGKKEGTKPFVDEMKARIKAKTLTV